MDQLDKRRIEVVRKAALLPDVLVGLWLLRPVPDGSFYAGQIEDRLPDGRYLVALKGANESLRVWDITDQDTLFDNQALWSMEIESWTRAGS